MIKQTAYSGLSALKFQQVRKSDAAVSSPINNQFSVSNQHVSQVPFATLQAYSGNIAFGGRISLKVLNSPSIDELSSKYGNAMRADIKELAKRAGKPKQFLNWLGVLQKDQLKRFDEIYKIAGQMRAEGGKGKLGIIGIGGSRHTVENVLTLTGHESNVCFLSATDSESIGRFVKKLGNLKEANVMVVSKSGTTMEPSVGYQEIEKAFVKEFAKRIATEEGVSANVARTKAKKEVAKHFVGISDANPQTSKLRNIINEKGYKSGIIHDDCGGRFGAFDDHVLMALAYSGMPKDDMSKMLNASLKAQHKFLSTDLSKNVAAQKAMFNVDSITKGKSNHFNYYFGDAFEGTPLWNVQLARESHKAQYFPSDAVGPAFLHYAAESDLDSMNKSSFYSFVTLANKGAKKDEAYNAISKGVLKAYSDRHPVAHMEMKGMNPESIAELVELKHLETMYTGMLLRSSKGQPHPEVLPEVLQPNVEIYKKEVRNALQNK